MSLSGKPDGFLNRDALYCQLNYSTSTYVTFIECKQPVMGRYLTIQQLEHWDHDVHRQVNSQYCLAICEAYIYVDGESVMSE